MYMLCFFVLQEAKSNDDDCWQADCPTTVEEYDQICVSISGYISLPQFLQCPVACQRHHIAIT